MIPHLSLFSLKSSIWQKPRSSDRATPMAVSLRSRYKALNSRIHTTLLNLKHTKESQVIHDADIREFYKFANSVLHTPNQIHLIKTSSGCIVSDPSTKAEIFNQYFISAFTPDDGLIPLPPYPLTLTCSLGSIFFQLQVYNPISSD